MWLNEIATLMELVFILDQLETPYQKYFGFILNVINPYFTLTKRLSPDYSDLPFPESLYFL